MSTYNKYNPPPPPVYTAASGQFMSGNIQNIKSVVPSNPYLTGLPVQFLTIPENSNRTTNTQSIIYIDFNFTPFTYLNFSNLTDDPSDFFTVYISNVPIGTIFIVNGPTSWKTDSGILTLTDTDSFGGVLPNASLTINARGTITSPTVYINMMVIRATSGFVAKAFN